MLFCHITSQVKDEPYPSLLSEKGGTGFPHLATLDADGHLLAKLGRVARTTENFRALTKEGAGVQAKLNDLAKKAEDGDTKAGLELFELRLDLNHLDAATARAALAKIEGLPDDKVAALEKKVNKLAFDAILAKTTPDKATHVVAGKKLAELFKTYSPADRMARINGWYLISVYAEDSKDAGLFGKAVDAFKAMKGINPKFVEGLATKLQAMKKKGG